MHMQVVERALRAGDQFNYIYKKENGSVLGERSWSLPPHFALEERDGEKEKFFTYRIVRICRRCGHENDIVKRTFGMFGSHGAFEVDEVYCPRHGQSVRGDILLFRV